MTNSGAQESVQILLIEDNAGDARLIREILAAVHETELVLTHTTNLADALAQVHQKSFGVMLLNLNLPDASGIDTLLRLRQHAPDVPIVVIAGLEDEATSLGAVRAGAQGYLVKTELQPSLLGRAIRYAIERQRLSGALRDSEEKYRTLLGAMADGVFVAQDYRFVFANQALATMLGYSAEAFVNVPFETVVAPEFLPLWMQRFSQRVAGGVEPPKNYEVRFLCKGAKTSLWVELRANRIQYQGRLGVLGIICDITERKRVEQAFRESEEKLRLFIEHAPAALAMFDREMRYLAFSRRWIKDYHLDDRHIAGCSHYEIFPEIPDHWKAVHQRAQQGEVVRAD
jgi:PAS domain S-box-containing protein